MSYDRFVKIIPKDHIFIVTNEIYVDVIKEQLPELPEANILLEPARRNTAPCIAWAAYHIRAINPNANIVVAPSDHLILKEEEFARCINLGLEFVAKYPALLTLGIKPNRPETGYGYIQIGEDAEGDIKTVKTFTEKPNLEFAKMFVESGEFFWNSGIFIWNVQTIIKAFQQRGIQHSGRTGFYQRQFCGLSQYLDRLRYHGEGVERIRTLRRLRVERPGFVERLV